MTYRLFEENHKGEQESWQILKYIQGKILKHIYSQREISVGPSRKRINYMKHLICDKIETTN